MALYRFVGDVSLMQLDGQEIDLKHFGQQVTLTDDQAKLALSYRVPLVPEGDFWNCGFTETEVDDYPTSNDQRSAPKTFLDKKEKAVGVFIQNMLNANKPAAPAAPASSEHTGGSGN